MRLMEPNSSRRSLAAEYVFPACHPIRAARIGVLLAGYRIVNEDER
jgi:hypothetical protein